MTYLKKGINHKIANGVTLNAGTTSDVVSALQRLLDGDVYHITEVAAEPGIDLEVDFTGIAKITNIIVRAYYTGAVNHAVRIQIYNYGTIHWDTLTTMATSLASKHYFILVPDDTDYISGGAAIIRFYHTEEGNSSHNLYVDYAALGC